MARISFVASALMALTGLFAGTASAQVVGPRVGVPANGPTVSPYINFARNPNAPMLNYYGLVRPQFQTNAGLRALQQQFVLSQSGPLPGSEPPDTVLVTGHAAVFMNYGGYFQSSIGATRSAPIAPVPARMAATTPAPAARLPLPGPR